MRIINFVVEEEDSGKNVGIFLKYGKGVSTRTLKSLKQQPTGITCNGKHIRTVDKIATGDVITLRIQEEPKEYLQSSTHVEILYDDEDVMVFNKPIEMPCHQSKKHQNDTLGNVFARYCAEKGLQISYRPLNRLDRNTTGVVVVAKNAYSAYKLASNMNKIYVGIATGELPEQKGTIEQPIARRDDVHILRMVSPEGQYAKTDYEVIYCREGYSLVKFHLHTGRTHQIRVHMAYLGYPLAGDELYGGNREKISRNALHCAKVIFEHPTTGKIIEVEAKLPQDMTSMLSMEALNEIYKNDT